MIYAMLGDMSTVLLLLTPDDFELLKTGRMRRLIPEQLRGNKVGEIIVAFFKSENEAIEALKKGSCGVLPEWENAPSTKPGETTCPKCNLVCESVSILEGKCVVCWKELAQKLQRQSN